MFDVAGGIIIVYVLWRVIHAIGQVIGNLVDEADDRRRDREYKRQMESHRHAP